MTRDDREPFWKGQLFDPLVGWKSLADLTADASSRATVTGRLSREMAAAWTAQVRSEEPWSLVGLAAWAAWLCGDGRAFDFVLHFSSELQPVAITPFRLRLQGDLVLRSVRQMTRDRLLDALDHQPCEADWWPEQDASGLPVAGMLFTERKNALSATDADSVPPVAQQLWLQLWRDGTEIHYALSGPAAWPLSRWIGEWLVLINQMLSEPMTVLQHLSLCSADDRELLESFQPAAQPAGMHTTVIDMWQRLLAQDADALVMHYEGDDWSREDIEALARDWEVSAAFHGLDEREVVAILLPFSPQWLALHIAAWRRCLLVLTLDPKDPPAWLEKVLTRARVQMVFRSPGVVLSVHPAPPITDVSVVTAKSRSTAARTPFGPVSTTSAIVMYRIAEDGHVLRHIHTHHALSLAIADHEPAWPVDKMMTAPPLGADLLEATVWACLQAGVVFYPASEKKAKPFKLTSPWLAVETLGGCAIEPSETEDGTYTVHLRPGVKAYVFNAKENLVPPGERGLLWLGGERLFQDYLDDPPPHHVRLRHHPEFGRLLALNIPAAWSDQGVLSIYRHQDHTYCMQGQRLPLAVLASTLATHPALSDVELIWRRSPEVQPELVYHSLRTLTVQPESLRAFLASRMPERFSHLLFTPATSVVRPSETVISSADEPVAESVSAAAPAHYLLLSALAWPADLTDSWAQADLPMSWLTLDDIPDDELALEPYLHARCSTLVQPPTEIFALPGTGWWAIQIAEWFATSPDQMPAVHFIDHPAPEAKLPSGRWSASAIQSWVQDWLSRIGFASAKQREQMLALLSADLSSLVLTQLAHRLPFAPVPPSVQRRFQGRAHYYSYDADGSDHGWQAYLATPPQAHPLPIPGAFLMSPLGQPILRHLVAHSQVESRRFG
jgi:hypothetical protein